MNKQTAVDFIVKQLDILNKEKKDKLIDAETFFIHKIYLIKEAKRMEKEQMKDAVLDNVTTHEGMRKLFREQFEKYYNKTFNNK